ncbi:MAG: hypothetical protein HeimC2_33280 [Candidatus Heimdallarchaeota archaeon LC_2]|nr:MAG: hypothetical protein HeimC2_34970 [Candidatus Heimdallarchaeota archaeon LC_2]OLS21496.1 MAG: hypothetical protein HeimC2_33280 [Candidatus Heimdallarchaeota archaeon LC_2]
MNEQNPHVRRSVSFFLIVLFVISLFSFFSIGQSQTEITEDTQPIAFFMMEEDDDFPGVHPLGIKEDSNGNIHSWMYYIEPERPDRSDQFFVIFYSVIKPSGESLFYEVDRQPFSVTRLSIFYKQDFYEFADGTVTSVFLKTTDFGTSIKRIRYDQTQGYSIDSISSPQEFDFTGHIMGPIKVNNTVEYFFPAKNTTSGQNILTRFSFNNINSDPVVASSTFPTLTVNNETKIVREVFDVAYANNSRYWLSSVNAQGGNHSLILVNDFMNGTYSTEGFVDKLNVAPITEIELFRQIRADIFLPQLVSTTSGKLYTFLSSFEGEFNYLAQWKNGTATRILEDLEVDPFFLHFLVHLGSYGDVIKSSSLSIQFASLSFALTLDIMKYNTSSGEIHTSRFQNQQYNSAFFVFASDDSSENDIGLVSSISMPENLKDQYRVLNGTIGSLYVIRDSELPIVTPNFINILFKEPETDNSERNLLVLIIMMGSLVFLTALGFGYLHTRNKQFKFPVEFNIKREQRKFTILERFTSKITNFSRSKFIYFSANKSRIITSTAVMTIPAIILLSLFTGLLSHQESLLVTYENQNSLNDQEDFIYQSGDFIWGDLWYKDEFTSFNLPEVEFAIPSQLSYQAFIKYGLDDMAYEMSGFTFFSLFEKRQVSFIDAGQNVTMNYPWNHQLAILDDNWQEYLGNQLLRGRLPVAPNEILVQESWYEPRDVASPNVPFGVVYDLNSKFEVQASELDIFFNVTTPGQAQNMTVVGVTKKVENQSFNEIKFWAEKLNTTLFGLRFLDSIPFYSFPELITEFLDDFSRLSLRPLNYINVRYDVFDLDRERIPSIIESFEKLATQTITQTGFSWVGRIDNERIVIFLENYFDASRDIQVEGVVLAIPALLLILMLTYDGLNIGKTSIQQEILRFRKEGMRTENIFSIFVFERLVTTTIATILSLLVVNQSTGFLLSLTGFFNFDNNNTPPVTDKHKFIIFMSVFFVLFVVGIIRSIQYFIKQGDWKYSQDLKGIKGDLIIITIGGLLAFGSNYLSGYFQDQANLSDGSSNIDPGTQLIILNLRLIALLIASFGGLIVLSKIMHRFFIVIGKFGWKISRSRRGLVFNGIRTNTGLYGRALLILILALFLIVPMIVVPSTLNLKYENEAYNDLGTDIRVENWHLVADETKNDILNHNDIEHTSMYFFEPVTFIANIEIRVFALDIDSYLETIVVPEFYREDYLENIELLSKLQTGQILTNEEFIERNTLTIGQSIPFTFENNNEEYQLEVVNSYTKLPVLGYELSVLDAVDATPLQMVMTLETLAEIQEGFLLNSTQTSAEIADELNNRNLMIRASSIYKVEDIVNVIRQGGTQIAYINQLIRERRHPFFRTFEFITHISLIIAAVAPLLSAMILARVLFERRKDELEVYLRAGQSKNMYTFQLSIEYLITVIIPSIVGIPLGLIWAYNNGAEFFGEVSKDLVWDYQINFLFSWMVVSWVLSMIIWIWQIRFSIDRHLKEVRL